MLARHEASGSTRSTSSCAASVNRLNGTAGSRTVDSKTNVTSTQPRHTAGMPDSHPRNLRS